MSSNKSNKKTETDVPLEARRDELTGRTLVDKKEAAKLWFKNCKNNAQAYGFKSKSIDSKQAVYAEAWNKKKKR